MQTENPTQPSGLVLDYRERQQFFGFHARGERFACAVTHRRAGKTVACIHELQRAAIACPRLRPRFADLNPVNVARQRSEPVQWHIHQPDP